MFKALKIKLSKRVLPTEVQAINYVKRVFKDEKIEIVSAKDTEYQSQTPMRLVTILLNNEEYDFCVWDQRSDKDLNYPFNESTDIYGEY